MKKKVSSQLFVKLHSKEQELESRKNVMNFEFFWKGVGECQLQIHILHCNFILTWSFIA